MGEYRSQIKPLYGTPLSKTHWSNQGLVGNWILNEGSGLIAHDDSGNDNHGTLVGMVPSPASGWAPGPHGPALAFDGSDDYVRAPSIRLPGGPNPRTVIIRAKLNTVAGYSVIAGYGTYESGKGTAFYAGSYAGVWYGWNIFYDVNTNVPSDVLWHQHIIQYDKGYEYYWLDNSLLNGRVAVSLDTMPMSNGPIMGCLPDGSHKMNGLISSVATYDRALSAEENAYLCTFPWCGYEDEKGQQEWLFNQNATAMQKIYRYYSIGGQ